MQLGPHVVLTRSALTAAGHSPTYGDHLVRHGRATRAAPSTYLGPTPDLRARVDAALEHAGRDGVITGWVGCRLLRLPYVTEAPGVDVLVPASRRRVTTAYVRVHPTSRPPAYWLCDGLRVAAPVRCVIDAARALSRLRDVRALVLGAGGSVTADELLAELGAGSRGGRALVGQALRDLQHGARSCPEAELADIVAAAAGAGRLPPFLLHPDVRVGGRLLGRPDGWFPGLGLGWEVDSRQFHGDDASFDATLARHDRWVAHGLSLLHLTPRRLRAAGPQYVAVLAAAAQVHRRRSEPPDLEVTPYGPLLPQRRRRLWRGLS